jgi:hypothetical protein
MSKIIIVSARKNGVTAAIELRKPGHKVNFKFAATSIDK